MPSNKKRAALLGRHCNVFIPAGGPGAKQPTPLTRKEFAVNIVADDSLSEQVIAALIAAPAHIAEAYIPRLEAEDFADWRFRLIFTSLTQCEFATHQEPGSLIIQINRHLLDAGHYKDTDDGLRATVQGLAGITGHPEMIHLFVEDLLEQRFRRAVAAFSLSAAKHAQLSPLQDVDASLRQVDELRRLRLRIQPATAPTLQAVRDEVTA